MARRKTNQKLKTAEQIETPHPRGKLGDLLTAIQSKNGATLDEVSRKLKWYGNHPLFQRVSNWTSRGLFQFHGGGDPTDGHVGPFVVVNP